MTRFVDLNNDYDQELDSIGWSSMLNVERIKKDVSLRESKATIEKAKALVDKYQKKTRVLLQGAEAEINSLPVAESSKRGLLVGLKKGMNQTVPKLEEHWRLEAQIVEQYENIISLLAASKGWEVSGKQLLFAHTDELNRFNSYLASIRRLGQQEDQMQKDAATRTNDNLQSLKEDLAK